MQHLDTSVEKKSPTAITVSQLTSSARSLLETNFNNVWVIGEISNLACPASGHIYFTLKDKQSQVRCAMFRSQCQKLHFKPVDGLEVLMQAKVSLYEARGDFQLIVSKMEEIGDGILRREFETLKRALYKAGLFSAEHKKPLPVYPHTIGLITSPTGAAVRDMLTTLARRYPIANIIIYPTEVQGKQSANKIVDAVATATKRQECDLLILSRGGGSLEDLWGFNEEVVARSVFDCPIPIITGVGHEIDTTIVDYVADKRAATPTAAAELAVPDKSTLLKSVEHVHRQLQTVMQHHLKQLQHQLKHLERSLVHPGQHIQQQLLQLDSLQQLLCQNFNIFIEKSYAKLNQWRFSLEQKSPLIAIQKHQQSIHFQSEQLERCMQKMMLINQKSLEHAASQLDSYSPLATLKRGFSITRKADLQVVKSCKQVKNNEKLDIILHDGSINCRVEHIVERES